MKQTAVEWLIEKHFGSIENCTPNFRKNINQAKEMEKEQQLELIQFLAERKDFKEHFSMSIFIAEDYLNQFKNK